MNNSTEEYNMFDLHWDTMTQINYLSLEWFFIWDTSTIQGVWIDVLFFRNLPSQCLTPEVYVDITMRAAKENEATTAEQYSRESVRIARTTRELLKQFAGAYHQFLAWSKRDLYMMVYVSGTSFESYMASRRLRFILFWFFKVMFSCLNIFWVCMVLEFTGDL